MSKKSRNKEYGILVVVAIITIVLLGTCLTGYCVSNPAQDNSAESGSTDDSMIMGDSGTKDSGTTASLSSEESLAKCLTEKGAIMYGANWCGYCNKQKEAFADAFEHIDYVECTEEQQKCTNAAISGYPTWIIDGEQYPGYQSFERLAELSGCEY